MRAPAIWEGSYDQHLVIRRRDNVILRGVVGGNVRVRAGGRFLHEGMINGALYVDEGASVYIHGLVLGEWSFENAANVEFHGIGTLAPGYGKNMPRVGPEGFGELDRVWARCVRGIHNLIDAAGVRPWAQRQALDIATRDAFRAAAGAIALTEATYVRMWALLAAAWLNGNEDLRVYPADVGLLAPGEEPVWSPADCGALLPWEELGRWFDELPELFTKLLSSPSREGTPRAWDYHEAIWPVATTMLGLDDSEPPARAVETLERYRQKVLQTVSAATRAAPEHGRPTKDSGKPAARKGGARSSATAAPRRKKSPIDPGINPVDSALLELDQMIGLVAVKEEVRRLAGFARVAGERIKRNMRSTPITRHLVMTGNAGTGKTTVARLLGQIYSGYGLLREARVTEVTRSDLVANIVGDTALKVKKVFTSVIGGVLFIDEAYSLAPKFPEDFGQEAINELVPLMERHRHEIMVVAAGYPEPMREFLNANPGLRGRFGQTIRFPDYSNSDLIEILELFCRQGDFVLTSGAKVRSLAIVKRVQDLMADEFDNARAARRLFEGAVKRQHDRIYLIEQSENRPVTDAELQELLEVDLPWGDELVP